MSQEINVHAEIPTHALAQRLLNDKVFMDALVQALRQAMLNYARSTGDVFGGYAGINSRDVQNLRSPVFQGHWNTQGQWVKN